MTSKLPIGWIECNIGDISEIVTGKTPSKKQTEYFGGSVPFVKPGDLDKSKYIIKSEDTLTKLGFQYAPFLPAGSVLVSCIGNLGKKGILQIDGSCNQQINAILPNEYVDNLYLYYYIDKIKNWMEANASATTVTILNKQNFSKAPLLLPPLAEQERIVEKIEEIFAKIDAGVEKLKSAQEKIKQYKQSVLHSAFTGKLYKTTEWKMCTLGDIIKPIRNRVNLCKENENFIFIGMDCIKPNELNICKKYIYKEVPSSAFAFKKKDVLYGRMRSYLNKVYEAEFDGIASAEFIIFRENDNIISSYLKYILHNDTFVEYATRNASGDRPRVKFDEDLSSFSIYLPTLPEQERIVEEIEKRFEKADKMLDAVEKSLETAEKLKQSVLKKAFEGKLVPQDPNDEPASVLLDRIKSEKQQNEKAKGKKK